MSDAIKQDRVTLARLKVADFASEETLCFSATVLFDGKPIADANNAGHGGATILRPHAGTNDRFANAEAFAKTLPPYVTGFNDPIDKSRTLSINVDLEFLVDHVAHAMHEETRLRRKFKRDLSTKVLFIRGGRMLYIPVKFRNVPAIERPAFFRKLRTKQGAETILAELPEDDAFALWKSHVVKEDSP